VLVVFFKCEEEEVQGLELCTATQELWRRKKWSPVVVARLHRQPESRQSLHFRKKSRIMR